MTSRLIPDLDDELTAALGQIEELLLVFGLWEDEDDPDDPVELPVPLADRAALAAVNRIQTAVYPTQGERAAAAGATGRLLGPDGRYEHVPLRLVDVDQADVDTLSAAARLLGNPRHTQDIDDGLDAGAGRTDLTRTELVVTIARVAGLLDLAATDDTRLLAGLLAGVGPADDLVLNPAGEVAYQRTVDRLNAMWADSNPLTRWAY